MRNRMLASAAVFSVLSICAYAVWLRVEGARMSRADWVEIADPVQ